LGCYPADVNIEIRGSIPLKATSTSLGLNLGDSVKKMVELYGEDYRFNDMGQYYTYVIGDHELVVDFTSNVVSSWIICNKET
jgi:hypothetical protein